MTDNTPLIVYPNVIQFYPGFLRALFWDYFCYIDTADYVIDDILNRHEIPVTFLKPEFIKNDTPYHFCMLKCRKQYTESLMTKIFPQLHQAHIVADRDKYIAVCQETIDMLADMMDAKHQEVRYENFSE